MRASQSIWKCSIDNTAFDKQGMQKLFLISWKGTSNKYLKHDFFLRNKKIPYFGLEKSLVYSYELTTEDNYFLTVPVCLLML